MTNGMILVVLTAIQLLKALNPNDGKLLQTSEGGDGVSWRVGKERSNQTRSNLNL